MKKETGLPDVDQVRNSIRELIRPMSKAALAGHGLMIEAPRSR